MTNVKLFSDLHLEFELSKEAYADRDALGHGLFHPGEGDVLILAGDICTAKDLPKDNPQGTYYRMFFEACAKNYNKVLYVMGNHEHYGHNFTYTANKLRNNLPTGITLLDKEVVEYGGWTFMGSTLWTDFGGNNPLAMQLAQGMMSDYKTIRFGSEYRKLFPEDILREHNVTRYWMEETLLKTEGPVFMITHHQPSFQSLDTSYRGSPANPFYATELSNFIMCHPQIKYWVAGHTHVSVDYPIEQCRVMGNPRGYAGYELNPNFDPNFTVELA